MVKSCRNWCFKVRLCSTTASQKRRRSIHLLYWTLLVYLQLCFWIKMPKPKREEVGSLSKYEHHELQRCYTQGVAAYGSVQNLVETSWLPESKVRQFLHSKTSHTKVTLAARKFKGMTAFASFEREFWDTDLAYVDELAKDNKGVKYLLVRQDLSHRAADAKVMKTKNYKETFWAFSYIITKKNDSRKYWVHKGTEFAGKFKKVCSGEGIQISSTMTETKPAFTERTIKTLKMFFTVTWKIMDTITLAYCLSSYQPWFPEENIRKNWHQRMSRDQTFCPFCKTGPHEKLENPSLKLDAYFSKYDLPFRKGYQP